MATLAEIKNNPAKFLGEEGTQEEYQMFVQAVETLIREGVPEKDAIAAVWDWGAWFLGADAVLNYNWRPTHRLVYGTEGTLYMMRVDNVLYPVLEWFVGVSKSKYEVGEDGEVFYDGRPFGARLENVPVRMSNR